MNRVLRRRHRRMCSCVALILLIGGLRAWRDHRTRMATTIAAGRAVPAAPFVVDGVP